MDPAEALENLQGMGFPLPACERALRVSDNSLDRCFIFGDSWIIVPLIPCRAIDWLLANPRAVSGEEAHDEGQVGAFQSIVLFL